MTSRPRTPGSTNAPGGAWYSAPAAKRRHKPAGFTLTPEALAALTQLCALTGGHRSAEVSAALCERAARLVPPSQR